MTERWAAIPDRMLREILATATASRAERKTISISIAAENVLSSAQRDFGMPSERLPTHASLIELARAISK